MAEQSGPENSPIDKIYVILMENDDSWKGTPLDVEEEQLNSEPTTIASTDDGDKASPPVDKKEPNHVQEASKEEDKSFDTIDKEKTSGISPITTVCSPTHEELEAFQKSPSPSPSPAAAASSKEALSLKSNTVEDPVTMKRVESATEQEAGATVAVSLPPSPPQNQLSALAADIGGNGARKELEDAIQRIETQIKVNIILNH